MTIKAFSSIIEHNLNYNRRWKTWILYITSPDFLKPFWYQVELRDSVFFFVMSCAEKDVNISINVWSQGRGGLIVLPINPSSFSHMVFNYPEAPEVTLMNLWRAMIHLSSTGRTWHVQLQNRWDICLWLASGGGEVLFPGSSCFFFLHSLITVSAAPSGHTE